MSQQTTEQASRRAAERFSEEVATAGSQAQQKFADAAEPLEDKARDMADQQKVAGADRLSRVGDAVHSAAQDLETDMPQLAGYIHSAAESLQDASNSLRTRNIEDLVGMYNDFSRKQPAAAFAGAVLAGFALSRFLKSSSPRAQS
jgi:hypothetical protein